MYKIQCPKCNQKINLKKRLSKFACPNCKTVISVKEPVQKEEEPLKLTDEASAAGVEDSPFLDGEGAQPFVPDEKGISVKRSPKSYIFIGSAVMGVLIIIIIGVAVYSSAKYKKSLEFSRREFSDITGDDAEEGIEACELVIQKSPKDSDDYKDAVFALGVYYYKGGETDKALEQFRNRCIDHGIFPLKSAVLVSEILFRSRDTIKAYAFISKVLEKFDASELTGDLKEKAAEIYAELIINDSDVSLEEVVEKIKLYHDLFPINATIEKAHKVMQGKWEEKTARDRENAQKQYAAKYTKDLKDGVEGVKKGIDLFDSASYVESYYAFRHGLSKMEEIPIGSKVVVTEDKKTFKEIYETFIRESEEFGYSEAYHELLALLNRGRDNFNNLPKILSERNYILRDGKWEKVSADMLMSSSIEQAESSDLTSIVRRAVLKMIDEFSKAPKEEEKTVIILKRGNIKYVGDVVGEDEISVTLKTLYGKMNLMKDSFKEGGRSLEMIGTREYQMIGKLQNAMKAQSIHEGLKDAARFAQQNRLIDVMRQLYSYCLYLKPKDDKIIGIMGYGNACLIRCPECGGRGFSKLGEKRECPRCKGKTKRKCKKCNGIGTINCRECISAGIHRGHVLVKKNVGGRVVTRYEACSNCGGHVKIDCEFCKGSGYSREKCEKCKGKGFLWKKEPQKCLSCMGKKRIYDPEYVRNPYEFLKGLLK